MVIRSLVIFPALAGLCFGYAQCPSLDSVSRDSPTTKVDLPAKQIPARSGAPVWVEVTMTNQSDHAISFWKNTNTNAYPIEVSDEAGKPLRDKRPGFRNGRFDPKLLDPKHADAKLVDSGELIRMLSGSLVCVTLKPGEKVVERVDVSKFYDMNSPGTYSIAVQEIGPAKMGGVRSSSVKLLVTKE